MHPSTHYIKYLVLKGWPGDETCATVNQTLDTFNLPQIEEDAFNLLRASLTPPANFTPNNRKHPPTVEYMREEKVFALWNPRRNDLEVLDLIMLPQVKETVQILLMGRFASDEIVRRLHDRYNRDLSERAIDLFRHYFWNVEITGFQEWAELLYDSRLRDAYLASLVGSKNQALFRAGFSPNIDGRRALREAHRNLTMRLEATRHLPDNKDTIRMLASLSKELVSVHNALFGDGATIEEAMKELRRFVMQRGSGNVIPIQRLAPAGNFSNSGVSHGDKVEADD